MKNRKWQRDESLLALVSAVAEILKRGLDE